MLAYSKLSVNVNNNFSFLLKTWVSSKILFHWNLYLFSFPLLSLHPRTISFQMLPPQLPSKNFFFLIFLSSWHTPCFLPKTHQVQDLKPWSRNQILFCFWYHLSSQLFHSYLLCSLLKDTTFSWKKSFKEKTICVSQPFSFLAWTSHLQSFLHIAIRLIRCSFSPQLLSGYFHFKSWLQLQQSQVELIVLVSQRYFPFISSFMFATTIFPVPQPRN